MWSSGRSGLRSVTVSFLLKLLWKLRLQLCFPGTRDPGRCRPNGRVGTATRQRIHPLLVCAHIGRDHLVFPVTSSAASPSPILLSIPALVHPHPSASPKELVAHDGRNGNAELTLLNLDHDHQPSSLGH